ncbi:MAG TPA: hypothetical protein VFW28_10955 [Micropepsaceae bacterium]|nr:hypothetical protein [Micropepsaceae bacterium]
MAVGTDAGHAGQSGELTGRLDKKQSIAATGDPEPDASRREMRNLRIVQKMHHVLNSGLYLLLRRDFRRTGRQLLRAPIRAAPEVMNFARYSYTTIPFRLNS